jgi:hypothetical protein
MKSKNERVASLHLDTAVVLCYYRSYLLVTTE